MQMEPSPNEVTYSVDAMDLIVRVNDNWDRFAAANDSPDVSASAVIGTQLWRHISDMTLRQLLRAIFAKARQARRPLLLTCRCDGPDVRRDLRLRIESEDGAAVHVTSTVVAEHPRQAALGNPETLLRSCSWCNRIDVSGRWAELEEAIEELQLLHGPHFPALTHALCTRCAEELLAAAAGPSSSIT